jgi:signal transduction histidine kinase
VTLRARRRGDRAELSVEDDGPGIAETQQEAVFARFYRVEGGMASGSGLGLAIARENARLLGGDIEATSEPGRTRFTLRLPVTEPLHRREDRVANRDEDAGDQPSTGGTA